MSEILQQAITVQRQAAYHLTSGSLLLVYILKQGVFLPTPFALCFLVKSLNCLRVRQYDPWKSWGRWEEGGGLAAVLCWPLGRRG